MMTDPDEFDAKEIEAASLKEEAASHGLERGGERGGE